MYSSLPQFEWDDAKSKANQLKHGISLAEAVRLWKSEEPVVVLPSVFPNEPRMLAIGKIEGKHWTVILTVRDDMIRLISARRSRKNECEIHDQAHHGKKS